MQVPHTGFSQRKFATSFREAFGGSRSSIYMRESSENPYEGTICHTSGIDYGDSRGFRSSVVDRLERNYTSSGEFNISRLSAIVVHLSVSQGRCVVFRKSSLWLAQNRRGKSTRRLRKIQNFVLGLCLYILPSVPFGVTYEKIGTIQRRLAWPLHKDDTLFQSGRPTGLNIYFIFPSQLLRKISLLENMVYFPLYVSNFSSIFIIHERCLRANFWYSIIVPRSDHLKFPGFAYQSSSTGSSSIFRG